MIHGVRFRFYAFMLWHSWMTWGDPETRFDIPGLFQRWYMHNCQGMGNLGTELRVTTHGYYSLIWNTLKNTHVRYNFHSPEGEGFGLFIQ
jgi:hypothetical protein